MTKQSKIERMRQAFAAVRRRAKRSPRPLQMVLTAIGGVALFVGALAIVLPGPALILIPVGFALLSLRFQSASRGFEALLAVLERLILFARRHRWFAWIVLAAGVLAAATMTVLLAG